MSGVDSPGTGNDGQQPWSVRPGGLGTPGQPQGDYDPFPSHAQPQQPYAPQPDPYGPTDPYGQQGAPGPYGEPAPGRQPFGGGNDGGQPDWSRLAEQRDAAARRRRLMFTVGGSVVGLALVGGIIAAAMAMSGGDDGDKPGPAGSSGTVASTPFAPDKPTFRPAPTVPPPPPAQDVLADPKLDTAPFTIDALFPEMKFSVDGRAYSIVNGQLGNTCSDGADAKLGPVLRNQQCTQLIRLAVTGPGAIVSTVAVASFPTPDKAKAIMNSQEKGILVPLGGPGIKVLDPKKQQYGELRNAIGRYTMLSLSWYADGKAIAADDKVMIQRLDDIDKFLRSAMTARGEATSKQIDAENRRKALEQVQG
ncbi:hypothetical protein [Streptomyces sp. SID3343]|uniref:hypothetical protein n=1 Tax=Streptomyces sp. SID3343 TaxID=2690260 RepID=UPI001372264F|nr:hypothetical protein [Streptomyces sp. SID3343]MYW06154.1 hypothetical protein [Streptomyces sp. SID3343]